MSPSDDASPARVGAGNRYEVIDSLGRGGMAIVQKVHDHVTDRTVAFKRLLSGPDDTQNAKTRVLFEREFHVLSQLAHPRVVQVYDYGFDAVGPYYTMELLDGGDLHALSPLPWQRACSLIRDVCSVVSLVHSRRLVHRDISPRNVRCTTDGLAKLLDFGAMAPMGPVTQIVGTPPVCAPELLDFEPLDARSDLYSLGATFYFALVGQHAYPARDFRHLRELWSMMTPAPPSSLVPDIPPDIDALVMGLLSLDSAARPVSAAEVMERLTAIAHLAPDEQLKVSNAYLYSPSLVGRTNLLERTHRRFARALEGRGSSSLLVGPSGAGRSRLFAACMLDAKLLGLTALRVDPTEGQRGEYGGVRAIARQLLDNLPDATLAAAAPRMAVLGHVIPELREHFPDTQLMSFDDPVLRRPRVQQALLEWLNEISSRHALALGIDDVDLVDEPTKAFAALLISGVARQPLAILVTAQPEDGIASAGPMKVIRDASSELRLICLDLVETEELIGSVFGDVPHRRMLAHRLFAISAGNPRDIMQLAHHLIERGAIRYASGSWSLPAQIDQEDLPATIAQAHQARIDALSEDSRILTQTLALAPDLSLALDHFQVLCGHEDAARMLRSLDELIAGGVFRASGRYFTFAQPVFAALLRAGMSDQAQRAAHFRLAALFEQRGETFRVAQHLLRAGEEERGVDTLLEHARASVAVTDHNLQAYEELLLWLPIDWFEAYRTGIELCKKLGRPRRELYALWIRVSGLTPAGLGDTAAVVELISQLRHDTGLDIYEALDPAMEPMARLGKSFELTAARYQATSEHERVLEALDALRALGRACIQAVGTVAARLDLELWEKLPSLEPFVPLSPALGVVDLLIKGNGKRITGRAEQACVPYRKLLDRATQPDRAGLDETHQRYIISGVCFGLGFMEAPMGLDSALEYARKIETDPLHQVNALLIRMLHHLWQGDARAADSCKHQIELMRIQNSPRTLFEGTHLIGEIAAHAASDDLVRVKQTIDSVSRMAENFPGWVPLLHLARGEAHRIRGAYADALIEIEQGLARTSAGRHQFWAELATAHLKTLDASGRHREAREFGERYLREAEQAELGYRTNYIKLPLATAYAALGEREIAETMADSVLDFFTKLGSRGLNPGLACEARARVAARVSDAEGFAIHARRCGELYRATANRALIAKYQRLMREARGVEGLANRTFDPAAALTGQAAVTHITGMLSACSGSRARAKLGLDLMVARSGALGGFLYAVEGSGPILMAQTELEEPPSGLSLVVAEYLRRKLDDADTTASDTISSSADAPVTSSDTGFDDLAGAGRRMCPTLICHNTNGRFEVTGLAVLLVDLDKPFRAPSDVAVHLSLAWLQAGDVTSVTAWLAAPGRADSMRG